MRTSATGKAERGLVALRRSAERGFTLVELLIVLTVIGLLSAAVTLAIPGGPSLRQEAERFAASAKAARDRAIVEGRPVAVEITLRGYEFEERRLAEWRPLQGHVLAGRAWEEGTRPAGGGARIQFDSTGYAEPAELMLQRAGEQAAVVISSDGRIGIDG